MESKSNKLVILDLDETLIHSANTALNYPCHFTFDKYFVYKRPGLQTFLEDVARHFQIGIWSSAGDIYVQEIVQQILPSGIEPVIVWGSSKCTLRRNVLDDQYHYEKRLYKLKNKGFRLEQILIVDDSPEKASANYGNAISINEFRGDPDDAELSFLFKYLLTLKTVDNVRTIEKRLWRQSGDEILPKGI